MTEDEARSTAGKAAELLRSNGWRLATAESCTGGWVAKLLTDLVGSSLWFERGFVTYTNDSKSELLGVEPGVIERDGAVSEATARAMADGALRHSRADIALAVTGIAGPGGATPDKPVGTVWFAWATRDGLRLAERCLFDGNRDQVRLQSVDFALDGIVRLLDRAGGTDV